MNGVYAWMTVGIAITAGVAYTASNSPQALGIIASLSWGLLIGTVILALGLQRVISRLSAPTAMGAFVLYSGLMGASLAFVPVRYPGTQIGTALIATVGMFAAMAVMGFVTKKDLSGIGQFLVMALFGAVIASLLNAFVFTSGSMSIGISMLVAVISAGLTAYYTQAIKQMYLVQGRAGNLALLGALVLYINFLNLFMSLLHIFGGSRD